MFEARYHHANARIATIVGTTIASMIATEPVKMDFWATPTGPCGSSTPILQPDSTSAQATAATMRVAARESAFETGNQEWSSTDTKAPIQVESGRTYQTKIA